jgi:hypothetical protein
LSLPFSKTSLVKHINVIVHIRQLCRKIAALAYHRCLNGTSFEVLNNVGESKVAMLDAQFPIQTLKLSNFGPG